jgi:hypothetical protein
MRLVLLVLYVVYGILLNAAGHSPDSWEWWALTVCLAVTSGVSEFKGFWENGNKD